MNNEPNEKRWEAYGLPCYIRRNKSLGFLCGYVGVKEDHPLFGQHPHNLDVHGGITFAGKFDEPDIHWIGFDCGHAGDLIPAMDKLLPGLRMEEVYRNMNYVTEETENLAKQLSEIVSSPDGEDA